MNDRTLIRAHRALQQLIALCDDSRRRELEFIGPKHPGFDYSVVSPNGKVWTVWVHFGGDVWSECKQRGIVIESYTFKVAQNVA